jgi:hypothetical protein
MVKKVAMKSARTVILIALLLSAMTTTALLLIDPPGVCPGWHLRHSSTSLWQVLAMWTAPILAFHCFIVVRWDWCLRKAAEKDGSAVVPAEYILIRMCFMGAVASQLPLLFVVDCIGT